MKKDSLIYVAGGTGLVGSAIINKLLEKGYNNIVSTFYRRKPLDDRVKWYQLDLTNQAEVNTFFSSIKPEYVFLAAAKVGGILANNIYRADFIYQNLQIQNNVIHHSYMFGVKKLLFLGSTCIYPRNCPQPIKEEYLLTGELEYTNEPYAIAKIAGIKMCESYNLQYGTNFISVMPTNLYGYNDNFDLEKSHVLPALLRKMYLASLLEKNDWNSIRRDLEILPIEQVDGNAPKSEIEKILNKYGIKRENGEVIVEIWGSGKPKREFLWSEDMADACIFLMENVNFWDIVNLGTTTNKIENLSCQPISLLIEGKQIRNTHINIGTGKDISIMELANLIKTITGFKGKLYFDTSKPDGTPRKVTDVSKLHSLGWKHKVNLEEGIKKLFNWYVKR